MYINVDSFRGSSKAELLRRVTTPTQAGACTLPLGAPLCTRGAPSGRGCRCGVGEASRYTACLGRLEGSQHGI